MSILEYIDFVKKSSGYNNAQYIFTNGKCLIFAKLLQDEFYGNIYLLPFYNHFVFEYNNKLYDATGCVTKLYNNTRKILLCDVSKKQLKGYEGV